MNTVTPKKKKVKSPKNKATVLENRVKELEEKLSSLEKKKTPLKTHINKVKKFVVKHKYLFIITSSLLFLIISWEGYSLYAYKAASNLTRSAQQQNDFGKAEEELLKMEKITNRSLVLFFLRRESRLLLQPRGQKRKRKRKRKRKKMILLIQTKNPIPKLHLSKQVLSLYLLNRSQSQHLLNQSQNQHLPRHMHIMNIIQ